MIVIESFAFLNLPSTDIRKTIEFYSGFLDFDVLQEGPESAVLSFENIKVRFLQIQGAMEFPSDMPILSFLMDTDDFTDALQILEENNIDILSGPDPISKGEAFLVKDPSNNIVEFFYQE